MQSLSNITQDSTTSEQKSINENIDDFQGPPPSYTSVIYKPENSTDENGESLSTQSPGYANIQNPSVFYINNYPGPPLDDGVVQVTTSNPVAAHQTVPIDLILSKRMRIYSNISAVLMICFGVITVGLQIGLISVYSMTYYYYGLWAGAIVLCIGVCGLLLNRRSRHIDVAKYFRSYIYPPIFLVIVFVMGLFIILTDLCDDKISNTDGAYPHSYEVLNGLLLAVIGLAFILSIINIIVLAVIKRRYSRQ
ncbi:unnamed protein product [Rotaria magnacalcarata]|uniref:Uncharacterized protein n=1 Tax=Rotaria magnacalcarata TaxID=392030 RepID=A0A816ASL6_9BILA|nr:unnamed protein product [Rotaria magnacalcarata]CAF4024602.1 unnamed protein product [Rotaria magnacalcarata]